MSAQGKFSCFRTSVVISSIVSILFFHCLRNLALFLDGMGQTPGSLGIFIIFNWLQNLGMTFLLCALLCMCDNIFFPRFARDYSWIDLRNHLHMEQCAICSGPIHARILVKSDHPSTLHTTPFAVVHFSTVSVLVVISYKPIISSRLSVPMKLRMPGKCITFWYTFSALRMCT